MPDEIEQTNEKPDLSKDPNEGQTMEEFVKERLGSELNLSPPEGDSEETEKKEEEEKSGAQELGETEKAEKAEKGEKKEGEEEKVEKEEEEDKKEEEKVEEEVEKKDPVPYERFEEVNKKYKETNEELEKFKPIVESHNKILEYCNQWGIDQDQFGKLLHVQRLINTDPQEALKLINPIVEQLQGFVGDKLPPDLQKKVDGGSINLEDARELARLRAQSQFGTNRFQQYQQAQIQRQHQQQQSEMANAATSWTDAKVKSDPDFKPKKSEAELDGKYEMVYDKFQSLAGQRDQQGNLVNPINSPTQAVALLERAYQSVSKSLAPFTKKPATKKPLTHNGSGTHNASRNFEEAKTMKEAIQMAVASHETDR